MTDTMAPAERASAPAPRRPPSIPGPLDVARSGWRRLRRMSTALALLFAMAAASVVATFVPQEPVIAATVADWRSGVTGPGTSVARAFDALGLFDVFGSWWFMTITVLLFTSLTVCLIPRYRAFARVARRPPPPGRNLTRLTSHMVVTTAVPPEVALDAAHRVLRRRRFRRRRVDAAQSPTDAAQVAAERGQWREGGSLVFHTAFYLLILGVVVGHTFGFVGQINLVEGAGFTDTRLSYDAATPGRLFGLGDHTGFTAVLEDFDVTYHDNQTPREFVSTLTLTSADGDRRTAQTRVNSPVTFEGMKLYQVRFGMAPHLVVRRADTGEPVYEESVTLLDRGGNIWEGQAKVGTGGEFTDPETGERVEIPQMALEVVLLPDASLAETDRGPVPVSASPEPRNPVVLANLLVGDLGLERNVPTSALVEDWAPEQRVDRNLVLVEGEPVDMAGGAYTVEFTDLDMWSGFQVSHAPGRGLLLAAGILILAGLVPSLYAYRRRIWVTTRTLGGPGAGTEVVVAGVALQRHQAFVEEFGEVAEALRRELPAAAQSAPEPETEVRT